MPDLDFMVTADYVRSENGLLHMIAAGFDTLYVPTVPASRQVGIGMRFLVDVVEARTEHQVTLLYQNADGEVLFEVKGKLGPVAPDAPLPPEGRPYGVPIAFNLPLPIPAHGDYSLELFIDDDAVKSITLTAAETPAAPAPATHA